MTEDAEESYSPLLYSVRKPPESNSKVQYIQYLPVVGDFPMQIGTEKLQCRISGFDSIIKDLTTEECLKFRDDCKGNDAPSS